jgi:Protein of unknown function (DUF4238)
VVRRRGEPNHHEARDTNEPLTRRERVLFALWLGLLYCRTPSYERAVNELLTGNARLLLHRNLRDRVARKHFTDPERQLEYVASDRFRFLANRNMTIAEMLRQATDIGKAFLIMDWVIARAPKAASFVTSDVPIGILAGPNQDHPVGVVSPEGHQSISTLVTDLSAHDWQRCEIHDDNANATRSPGRECRGGARDREPRAREEQDPSAQARSPH